MVCLSNRRTYAFPFRPNASRRLALRELVHSQDRIEELEKTNLLLRQKIDALIRRFFGDRKSDSIDPNQLELVLKGLSIAQAIETPIDSCAAKAPAQNKGQAKRRTLPEHLETQEVVIDPPEVTSDPAAWKQVGQETCEELDWIPSKLIRRLYNRRKYTPVDLPEKILIAPMPPRVIDKGIAGPALLAYILISKYVDHLPLHRLEKIFINRFKVPISRKTMADWVEVVTDWLKPIYNYLKVDLLKGDYVQADETKIRYLDRNVKGKSKQGYLWVFSHPQSGTVLFDWNKSRGHEVPLAFLGDFSGTLQCDGYSGYVSLSNAMGGIVLVGCWAHLYQRVREALPHFPIQAGWILRQMQHLYGIEKQLREDQATEVKRLKKRDQDSRPIVQRLHTAFKIMERRILEGKLLPKSTLGEATTYAQGR